MWQLSCAALLSLFDECVRWTIYLNLVTDLQWEKNEYIGVVPFGTVFRGTYNGQMCAAKMLTHLTLFSNCEIQLQSPVQETALESILKKSEFLKKLSHDNIVHYITITVEEPISALPILVEELMDYTLKTYLSINQGYFLTPVSLASFATFHKDWSTYILRAWFTVTCVTTSCSSLKMNLFPLQRYQTLAYLDSSLKIIWDWYWVSWASDKFIYLLKLDSTLLWTPTHWMFML